MTLHNNDKHNRSGLIAGRIRRRRLAGVWAAVVVLAGWLMTAGPVLAQTGGEYELSSWTVDSGGSTELAGGQYRLMSTVGQPDAEKEVVVGGDYILLGGMWPSGVPIIEYDIYLPTILKTTGQAALVRARPTPLIRRFTVDPPVIVAGEQVTVAWTVEGADEVEVSPLGADLPLSQTVRHTPQEDTSYTLVAAGGQARARQVITVMVKTPSPQPTAASTSEASPPVTPTLTPTLELSPTPALTPTLEPSPTPAPTLTPTLELSPTPAATTPAPDIIFFQAAAADPHDADKVTLEERSPLTYKVAAGVTINLRWEIQNAAQATLSVNGAALGDQPLTGVLTQTVTGEADYLLTAGGDRPDAAPATARLNIVVDQ